MVNVAGLNQTMQYIEEHPEEWDQGNWAVTKAGCGTAYCFAGTWAALNGAEFDFNDYWIKEYGFSTAHMAAIDGSVQHVSRWASESLELEGTDSEILFRSTNSLADLREMVKLLSEGEDLEDHFSYYEECYDVEDDDEDDA
jgi:hypothetical protein